MTDSKISSQERPTSPHLGIYKPQINSIMSILHRLTGIGLFIGFAVLAWWMIFWVFSKFSPNVFSFISHPIVKFGICLLVISFFYHLLNGIRHLFWDMGIGHSICALFKTSYLVILGTLALSGYFFYLTNWA
jgi:succinate dehydrogenase / fumarate reductase cytochrome b subunit